MRRSGGLTFSAIVVFVGCGLIFLLASLEVLAVIVMPHVEGQPPMARYFLIVGLIFILGFVGWGIATGVDLLRLKGWARISMLVFCGLLLFVSVPAVLIFAFIPIPVPQDAELPENFVSMLRVGVCIFYGLLGTIAGVWLYFFSRKSVKEQFKGNAPVEGAARSGRPLSISIIGWYLVISTFFAPLAAFFHFPISILGWYLTGLNASLVMAAMGIVQLATGIGLLKLRPWGRLLTIWYFSFLILNSLLMVLLPGSQARFDQTMVYSQRMMGTISTPMHIPIWMGLAFSLPFFVVILWFVVTSKRAFVPEQGVASQGA